MNPNFHGAQVKPKRCEGWRRTGIFHMGGTGRWEQCKNPGIVTLKFKDTDSGKIKTLPACKECWVECISSGVEIIKACSIKAPLS